MSDAIREKFIETWTQAARDDNGEWLRKVLQRPNADLNSLVESMTIALNCIETEELDPEDPEWDPNFALGWQTYGRGRENEFFVGVYLTGDDHVALFGEYDGFELIDLSNLVEKLSVEHIVVEMEGDMELDEMILAVGHIEDSLGLDAPPIWSESPLVLMWNKNGKNFEARLDGEPLDDEIRQT